MKKLIVTAHDFGLCRAVNDGILWCLRHKNNVITEVALIPNAAGSADAAVKIKNYKISVSLNTTFTTGKPLGKSVPSLVDARGNFRKVYIENWDFSGLNNYTKADLEKELESQWKWFINNLHQKPSALLSRKNEFADPLLLELFVSKAKKEKVPIRTPLWSWKANYSAQAYVGQSGVKSSNGVYVGLLDWKGRFGYNIETDCDRLFADIDNSGDLISELIVFPGFVDKELFAQSSVNWQRSQFLKILQNGEFSKKLKQRFRLISYRDIK